MTLNSGWRHWAQIELQATRQHRRRHLLGVGGGQHEFEVLGRLFQRLQHRIEGGVGEHVNLVDHVDLEAAHHRLIDRLIEQLGDLFDAAIGGCVEFDVIHETACVDVLASRARATRRGCDAALTVRSRAVQTFGQNARDSGFAHPPRASEQISMMQALLRQRIGQRLHHVRLPHKLFKVVGTILSGEDQITHEDILGAVKRLQRRCQMFTHAPQDAKTGPQRLIPA